MKSNVLFLLWSALSAFCFGVEVFGIIRHESYIVLFFWIFSLIFAVLALIEYVDIKTTDV